ncbi:SDR family NAD(P)-dependent oxidoreductase [Agromyces archimandritae]|uniref:SDR family NAD(P)-dependent oxidoreductase n=1 Tax=Agromyces archimandritae TaxID=2781962 RepID=A0A975FNZ5_9MICO|nr:SDR family NAD(P)-dependent oxidoreductase [Agromyces archimandritae]QTX05925.1 SDR family NAD(P)-dependent oxidoreductase [Agromyces archimandritae]
MTRTVRGANVLITGAAAGMGRMYAELAVEEAAASVVLWDRDAAALARVADELGEKSRGRTGIRSYVVDVSDLGGIAKTAQKTRKEVGTPDILFNNAGIVRGNAYFWESDSGDDTRPTMQVNALAPMYIAREFLPGMIALGRPSRIVNIASAAGTLGNPRMAVYAASKAALIGWSDSLRIELEQAGHDHVKVVTVTPSYISTGMFAGARGPMLTPILEPEVVVERVWQAMLDGRPLVELPASVRLARILRAVLPTRVFDRVVGDGMGVYRSMERFTGRPAQPPVA